jgi:hypothetical protein
MGPLRLTVIYLKTEPHKRNGGTGREGVERWRVDGVISGQHVGVCRLGGAASCRPSAASHQTVGEHRPGKTLSDLRSDGRARVLAETQHVGSLIVAGHTLAPLSNLVTPSRAR